MVQVVKVTCSRAYVRTAMLLFVLIIPGAADWRVGALVLITLCCPVRTVLYVAAVEYFFTEMYEIFYVVRKKKKKKSTSSVTTHKTKMLQQLVSLRPVPP